MNAQWVQRRLSELQRSLGRRPLILEIPGGGQPPGLVAVFGRDGPSGCLDAFVISYGRDPEIRSYTCR